MYMVEGAVYFLEKDSPGLAYLEAHGTQQLLIPGLIARLTIEVT